MLRRLQEPRRDKPLEGNFTSGSMNPESRMTKKKKKKKTGEKSGFDRAG